MEVSVAEPRTVDEILTQCEAYWRKTNVPQRALDEMRAELRSHLHEALAAAAGIRKPMPRRSR